MEIGAKCQLPLSISCSYVRPQGEKQPRKAIGHLTSRWHDCCWCSKRLDFFLLLRICFTLLPNSRGSCLLSTSPWSTTYYSMDERPCVPLMSFQLPRLLLHSPAAGATQPRLRFHLREQANGPEPGELLSDLDFYKRTATTQGTDLSPGKCMRCF